MTAGSGLSRRQLIAAGTTGLIAAPPRCRPRGARAAGGPRPRTAPPSRSTSPGATTRPGPSSCRGRRPARRQAPRVRIGQRVITAVERALRRRGAAASVTWTYHARVDGLRPGATYGYAVTADNDVNAADPFSATFRTAPEGRAAFRFTSFGDLTAPDAPGRARRASPPTRWARWRPSSRCSTCSTADLGRRRPRTRRRRPQAWRDFGNNVQASAANRPWLPVPGDHGAGPADAGAGARVLPGQVLAARQRGGRLRGAVVRVPGGHGAFVCLSGDDVRRGYSGGAQTRWLEATLAAARRTPRSTGSSSSSTSAPARRAPAPATTSVRPRHQAAVAAAVRHVRGRPGAVRARPGVRAVVPGPRLRLGRHPAGRTR